MLVGGWTREPPPTGRPAALATSCAVSQPQIPALLRASSKAYAADASGPAGPRAVATYAPSLW